MIKKIIVCICVLLSMSAFAQKGTSSSYSFYGIGETKFKGTSESRSMAGLSVFSDSIHVNLQNPAGYGGLKFTTFTVSGSYNNTNAVTTFDEGRTNNTTVDYLAVAVPLSNKWSAGFGLLAYSAVGYRIQSLDAMNQNVAVANEFQGNGGVNRAFFSTGYKVTPNLSIGATVDYNFGEIETSALTFLEAVQFGSQELNISQVSGFSFNTGAMWEQKVNDKNKLYLSAMYTPESTISLTNSRTIATVQFSPSAAPLVIDEQIIDVANTEINLPSKFNFGAGFGQERKWSVGAEFTLTQTGSLQNRFEDITNATFEDSRKFAIGGYYIPEYNSFSSYFKRMVFRGGLRYENTGLVVDNQSINDTAVTFGLGFPIRGSLDNVNLGFELGRRGTKAMNLIQENYVNVVLSFSLNDKWFVKRKIN